MNPSVACLAQLDFDLQYLRATENQELFYYSGSDGEFLRVRVTGASTYELFCWTGLDKVESFGADLDDELVRLRLNTLLRRNQQETNIEPGHGFTTPRVPVVVPEEDYQELYELLKGRVARGESIMQTGDSFPVAELMSAINKLNCVVAEARLTV